MQPDRRFRRREKIMNRAISLLAILLLAICQARAQEKRHREQWQLQGPVRSMRVEKILLTDNGKQEKSVELLDEASFDERGNLVFVGFIHPIPSGRYSARLTNTYDAKGTLIKTAVHNADGSVNRDETYSYDGRGRKIETVWQWAGGKVFHQTTYTYNSRGLLTEEASRFSHRNWALSRTNYSYDEKGRRTELTYSSENPSGNSRTIYEYDDSTNRDTTTIYDAEGKLFTQWIYRHDDRGRDVEVYLYGQDAALKRHSTMAYESDSRGNWTKLKITREVYKDGQSQVEHEVQRRIITYY
jgi:YD repeat-containing protein